MQKKARLKVYGKVLRSFVGDGLERNKMKRRKRRRVWKWYEGGLKGGWRLKRRKICHSFPGLKIKESKDGIVCAWKERKVGKLVDRKLLKVCTEMLARSVRIQLKSVEECFEQVAWRLCRSSSCSSRTRFWWSWGR